MGRKTTIKFREIVGIIKDKASLSKASLLSNNPTLRLAVLRSTTHAPPYPPQDRRISSIMELGDGSRATASALISALMDRLHNTKNSVVALKCLIIIHNVIKRGPFILQDQLSIFPRNGGYNYLNLSAFRDGSSPAAWALSAWVRWYAGYLETLLTSSRVLGYFLCSSSSGVVRENQEHRISSYLNVDLVRDVDSLAALTEEACKVPAGDFGADLLAKEIVGLLRNDHLSIVNELFLRLGEVNERFGGLTFADSVELVCALRRLKECREALTLTVMPSPAAKKPTVEATWSLVEELRGKIEISEVYREGGGRKVLGWREEKGSVSDRFGQPVSQRVGLEVDRVRIGSCRFDVNHNVY